MIKILEIKSVNDVNKFNEIANKALQNEQTHGLLVKFYADWCGHCQSMKEDWNALTTELKNKYECKNEKCSLIIANIRVESMDNNDKIMANLKHIPKDIQGVPSIMFVSNGKRGQEYTGEKVFAEMLNWVINNNNFTLKKKTNTTISATKSRISNRTSATTASSKSMSASKSRKSSTIKKLIKQAIPKFKENHSKTLRDFHRKLRSETKTRSVKNRTQTPGSTITNNNNNNNNIPK